MHDTNMLRQEGMGGRRALAFVTAAAALAAMLLATEARAQSEDCREAVLAAFIAMQIAIPGMAKQMLGQATSGQENAWIFEAQSRERAEHRICGRQLPAATRRRILLDYGVVD